MIEQRYNKTDTIEECEAKGAIAASWGVPIECPPRIYDKQQQRAWLRGWAIYQIAVRK